MSAADEIGEPVPGRPDLRKITREPVPVVPNPHHRARTKARKRALDILFEAELRDRDILVTLDEHLAENSPPVRPYTAELVRGVRDYLDDIDDRIDGAATAQWTIDRMPRVDRNLARVAVYELGYTEAPPVAVISECVGLAEEFSTDDSARFLNGLLGHIAEGIVVTPAAEPGSAAEGQDAPEHQEPELDEPAHQVLDPEDLAVTEWEPDEAELEELDPEDLELDELHPDELADPFELENPRDSGIQG